MVAQLGARRHYAVPSALHRAGFLDSLVTDACADTWPWQWLGALLPEPRRKGRIQRVLERTVPGVSSQLITGIRSLDMFPPWSSPGPATQRWARRNAAFCRAVVRRGFGQANSVYAFNGAALEIFQAAREQGLRTILDQTAAPWRWNARLLREEVRRWPGWEDRPTELDESGVLAERERREWELADIIVCGSAFCRSALVDCGVLPSRCRVLAHPTVAFKQVSFEAESGVDDRPMRVLFAGALQLRKGIQYLYEAARILAVERQAVEFRLVGKSLLSEVANNQLSEYCDLTGAVPRSRMAAHFQWADVLVLPTLSEGSANVCHEAMAVGIPVITTEAAGSAVQDRRNGLIVPDRDSRSLAEAISWMADNSYVRRQFREAAQTTIRDSHHMATYREELRTLVEYVAAQPYTSRTRSPRA